MSTTKDQSRFDNKKLLMAQIKDLKKRVLASIEFKSNHMAPSLAMECMKLVGSACGTVGENQEILRELMLLQIEFNMYPKGNPKEDPLLQLRWIDGAISKLETLVSATDLMVGGKSELHPKVIEVSEGLFKNGHYSEGIFEALKALEEYVRTKSGVTDRYGTKLMSYVFDKDNPVLRIKQSHTLTEKEEQEGIMHIFMGAILAIKNPKSHVTIRLTDPERAYLYLAFVSLLFELVDDANTSPTVVR